MKRIFIFFSMLVAIIAFIVIGDKGEPVYSPEIGSIEYINDAKICAVYYKLIDDKYDDVAKAELSAAEAVFWEIRTNQSGISLETARQRVIEEMDGYLNKMDDPALKQNIGTKKILLQALANKRGCAFFVVSGQKNLISEVESSLR